MAYVITKTNGNQLVVVDDGSIDIDACDLSLIGKNYAGYGFAINQNFIRLLENFANSSAPANPLTGQAWYDVSAKKLKIYNGSTFKGLPSLESSSYEPTDLLAGDLWFDSSENKLYYYDGSTMNLIGPQYSGQVAINDVVPAILEDSDTGANHYVLKHQIQDYTDESVVTTIAITADTDFNIDAGLVPGYTTIKKGITLYGTNASTGVSATDDTDPLFWGTSSDSLRLNGKLPSEYVLYTDPTFNVGVAINSNNGVNIATNKLRLFVDNTTGNPRITSNTSKLNFFLTAGAASYNVFNIDATTDLAILPSTTAGALTNIGSSSQPFNIVYCKGLSSTGPLVGDLQGTATTATYAVSAGTSTYATYSTYASNADLLKLGGVYVAATTTNTANTIVARDASGNFSAGTLTATATYAKYADLAECYTADALYEPGTVLEIGGTAEVTVSTSYASEKVVGVVSTDPAYLMNSELENGVAIALRGRVPCKVVGPIKRGDALVSSPHPGYAVSRDVSEPINPLTILGKALQDFDGDFGIIEILV